MQLEVGWRDVVMVELALLALLSPWIGYLIWGMIREIREERRRDQAEAEALRAEGFPPGHPTHRRPSHPHRL
ncbi:MAG TPA: hypothetical protein VJQ57_15835 [Acidimicrobiia bacterium]|nr:hypothetical protein [Acidimicrobiia bacterium]